MSVVVEVPFRLVARSAPTVATITATAERQHADNDIQVCESTEAIYFIKF